MFVCCVCCEISGLCDGLITGSEESYRMCVCVCVCACLCVSNFVRSRNLGCCATKKTLNQKSEFGHFCGGVTPVSVVWNCSGNRETLMEKYPSDFR
jgi:hypothetical protein